jgi:hypothetical protein
VEPATLDRAEELTGLDVKLKLVEIGTPDRKP